MIYTKNLSAEMVRHGISILDVSKLLDCTDRTVQNKINEVSNFDVSEAIKIRDTFFPGLRLEYLFASDHHDRFEFGPRTEA